MKKEATFAEVIDVCEMYSTVSRALNVVLDAIHKCRNLNIDIGASNNPEAALREARHYLYRAEASAEKWVDEVANYNLDDYED